MQSAFLLINSMRQLKTRTRGHLVKLIVKPLQHQIVRAVFWPNGVLDVFWRIPEKLILRHEFNIRILRFEVFAGLYSFDIVTFFVHQVVELQSGEVNRSFCTLCFSFHSVLFQQNRAVRLWANIMPQQLLQRLQFENANERETQEKLPSRINDSWK